MRCVLYYLLDSPSIHTSEPSIHPGEPSTHSGEPSINAGEPPPYGTVPGATELLPEPYFTADPEVRPPSQLLVSTEMPQPMESSIELAQRQQRMSPTDAHPFIGFEGLQNTRTEGVINELVNSQGTSAKCVARAQYKYIIQHCMPRWES